MDIENAVKRGKMLNLVLIIVTLLVFVGALISNYVLEEGVKSNYISGNTIGYIFMFQNILFYVYTAVSLICLIFGILLMKDYGDSMKGIGLLIASAVIALIFSRLKAMLGIIVFILSSISINQMSKSGAEQGFRDKLDSNDMGNNSRNDFNNFDNRF